MKNYCKLILSALLLLGYSNLHAAINVFACEPEWAALTTELGGESVNVYSATTAFQDPHHIQARPSLIAKVRNADLVVCSGAELETGWLPLLLRQAGNAKVLPGKPGYFEAAEQVERLDVRESVDRTEGDVHASGNPHVHLDPRRILIIADALSARLNEIDSLNKAIYATRLDDFTKRWQEAIQTWQDKATKLRGKKVIVHHRDWVYLFDWLGVTISGALEPRPGLPTTAGHLALLKQLVDKNNVSAVVHTTYQSPRAAKRFSDLSGLPVIQLPYTVGGDPVVTDLFSLFDVTIDKLLATLK